MVRHGSGRGSEEVVNVQVASCPLYDDERRLWTTYDARLDTYERATQPSHARLDGHDYDRSTLPTSSLPDHPPRRVHPLLRQPSQSPRPPLLSATVLTRRAQDGPEGIDVCLTCFNGSCPSGSVNAHALLHFRKTRHAYALNIRRMRRAVQSKRVSPPSSDETNRADGGGNRTRENRPSRSSLSVRNQLSMKCTSSKL